MTLKETLAHFKGVDTSKDILQLTFYDDQDEIQRQIQLYEQIQKYTRKTSYQSEIPKRLAALLFALLDHNVINQESFAQSSAHYGNILINEFIVANPNAVKDSALDEASELEIKDEAGPGRRQTIRETNSILQILTEAENTSLFHSNQGELVWVNLQKFTDEELLRFHLQLLRRENKLNSNIEVVLQSAESIENTYNSLGKKLVEVIKQQEVRKMQYLSKGLMPGGKPLTLNLLRLSGTMDKAHLTNFDLSTCRNIMALDFSRLTVGPKEFGTLLEKVTSSLILETLRSIDLSNKNLTKVASESIIRLFTRTPELKIFIINQCTLSIVQVQGILSGLQQAHALVLKIFRASYVTNEDKNKRGLTDALLAKIIKAMEKTPLAELSIAQSGAQGLTGYALSQLIITSDKIAILDISSNFIPQLILSDQFTRAVNHNLSLAKLYMNNMKNVARSGCPCCPTEAEFTIDVGPNLTNKIKKNHAARRKIEILTTALMEDINNDVVDSWESVYRHVESTVSQDFFTCFRRCAKFKRQCYIENKNAQNFMEALTLHWMAQSASHPPAISYVINQFPQHAMPQSLPPPQMPPPPPLALGMQQTQPQLPAIDQSLLNPSSDQLLVNQSQYAAAMDSSSKIAPGPIPMPAKVEESKEEQKEPQIQPKASFQLDVEKPKIETPKKKKGKFKEEQFIQHQTAVLASLKETMNQNESEISSPLKDPAPPKIAQQNNPQDEFSPTPVVQPIEVEQAEKEEVQQVMQPQKQLKQAEEEAKLEIKANQEAKQEMQDLKLVEEELKEMPPQEVAQDDQSKSPQIESKEDKEKQEEETDKLINQELDKKSQNERETLMPSPFGFNTTVRLNNSRRRQISIYKSRSRKVRQICKQNSSKELIDYIK